MNDLFFNMSCQSHLSAVMLKYCQLNECMNESV